MGRARTFAGRSGEHDSYRVYSIAADHQTALTTRHRVPFEGDSTVFETNVFQVSVSMDAEATPTFLAFNWAGVSSMFGRAVLLVNLETHRFAVKYRTGPEAQAQSVDAIGVGGVDRGTGVAHSGHYYARYTDDLRVRRASCVNNTDQTLESDDAACLAAAVPLTWTEPAVVADYLGMSEPERARLASYLAKFATPDALSVDDTPGVPEDADRYFPIRIE